jgi:hypothetical protein
MYTAFGCDWAEVAEMLTASFTDPSPRTTAMAEPVPMLFPFAMGQKKPQVN